MSNALFITDYSEDTQEMNLIMTDTKKQGGMIDIISTNHFHLDVLFDHQYGHPRVKKFKKQVEATHTIYVMFQSWNRPLLWRVNALFKFLSKEELEGKDIVPVVISEGETCKNEVYTSVASILNDYFNESYSKWIFIQK